MAKNHSADQFIETPFGIFTASGNWFHITSKQLEKTAPNLIRAVPVKDLVKTAESWVRSGDSLSILVFMNLVVFTNLHLAAIISLVFLPLWHLNKSSWAGPALSPAIRAVDIEFIPVLAGVAALSYLGINGFYYELGMGFLFFFLFKFGWYRKIADGLYTRLFPNRIPLNDRILNMLVIRFALKEGEVIGGLKTIEAEIMRLIREKQKNTKK